MAQKQLVILCPTRNESRSVPLVMAELSDAVKELAESGWSALLLVIDDQSTDNTVEVIGREAALRGITVDVRQGPGSGLSRALAAGMRRALELEPTLIATFDFDGQHDASQLPALVSEWERSNGIAAVFGSRFLAGSSVTGVRGVRKLISRSAQLAIRLSSAGPRVPADSTTSLRVFTPELTAKFLDAVPSTGLDGYRMFSWFAVYTSCRYQFSEVPIDFRPRLSGVSNLTLADILSFGYGLKSLRELSKDWLRQRDQLALFPDYPNGYLEDLGELHRYNAWMVGTFSQHVAGRVADVGAGTGTFTKAMAEIPAVGELVAFEPDPVRHEELASSVMGSEIIRSVCGPLHTDHGVFDTIVYLNSLEHIEGLLAELRVAAAACRPGGTLVVFGPGMELLYGELDRLSGHFRRFSISRLRNAVIEAGFEVVDARYVDPVGALPYVVSNRLLRDATLRPALLPLYERILLPMSRLIAPLTQSFWGKNVVMVARRPAARST